MIALIDYGAGNLTSVRKALTHLGAEFSVPDGPADLDRMAGVIVPGVGNFEATAVLAPEWRGAIAGAVGRGTPLLGICLGLQWLFEGSEEAPGAEGLGAMPGTCALIRGGRDDDFGIFKVPHVGWNSLHVVRDSWLLDGVGEGDQVYFTHSYAAPVTADCVASTRYGIDFASAVQRGQVAGVQFHPEKSGDVGLRILRNFLQRATL
ncbi:MAG: imidazole glycerol phosphate synthase subunit HisH [Acidobacteria bacterium]|nr:imidazole glycerol phosphate synthase subunit HisH [Acidobacteriota bacterium]